MIEPLAWTARTFTFDLPLGAFPAVLERLRGTPARAGELVAGVPEDVLGARHNGKWSAKENLGHLSDLEPLDEKRLQDFLAGAAVLTAADVTNPVTETAGHNQTLIAAVLEHLRNARLEWVRNLESLTEQDIARSALHPRLRQPMRLLDWTYFIAEHDDHHLAKARLSILGHRRSAVTVIGDAVLAEATPAAPVVPARERTIPKALELFRIPEGISYLNCATMAPQLRSATAAGLEATRLKEAPWNFSAPDWFTGAETLRELAAQVLGTEADGVALVPAASYGLAVAAANLPVRRGQSIVLLDQEFPSNVYVWHEVAKKQDARVATVRRRPDEGWTEALLETIDEETAVVSVPHCHWTDGTRIDLVRVGERVRAIGAALVIDASQSLGACPLDLSLVQPDFLVAVGYKWLLGPYSLGYLYAAPKWRETGAPIEWSWMTRAGSDDFARLVDYREDYRPGARRFDVGEFSQFTLVPMAAAALRQILAWGVGRIQESVSLLTDHAGRLAAEAGYVVAPREERLGHIIGIRLPRGLPGGLLQQLASARVYVSVRGDSIRVAPHAYNDTADIDRLFAALDQARRTA